MRFNEKLLCFSFNLLLQFLFIRLDFFMFYVLCFEKVLQKKSLIEDQRQKDLTWFSILLLFFFICYIYIRMRSICFMCTVCIWVYAALYCISSSFQCTLFISLNFRFISRSKEKWISTLNGYLIITKITRQFIAQINSQLTNFDTDTVFLI